MDQPTREELRTLRKIIIKKALAKMDAEEDLGVPYINKSCMRYPNEVSMEKQNPPNIFRQLSIVPKVFYKLVKAGWTYRDTIKFIIAILKQGR